MKRKLPCGENYRKDIMETGKYKERDGIAAIPFQLQEKLLK